MMAKVMVVRDTIILQPRHMVRSSSLSIWEVGETVIIRTRKVVALLKSWQTVRLSSMVWFLHEVVLPQVEEVSTSSRIVLKEADNLLLMGVVIIGKGTTLVWVVVGVLQLPQSSMHF